MLMILSRCIMNVKILSRLWFVVEVWGMHTVDKVLIQFTDFTRTLKS